MVSTGCQGSPIDSTVGRSGTPSMRSPPGGGPRGIASVASRSVGGRTCHHAPRGGPGPGLSWTRTMEICTDTDRAHLARAIELAHRGAGSVKPNPIVGAVVAREGDTLGEGWH